MKHGEAPNEPQNNKTPSKTIGTPLKLSTCVEKRHRFGAIFELPETDFGENGTILGISSLTFRRVHPLITMSPVVLDLRYLLLFTHPRWLAGYLKHQQYISWQPLYNPYIGRLLKFQLLVVLSRIRIPLNSKELREYGKPKMCQDLTYSVFFPYTYLTKPVESGRFTRDPVTRDRSKYQ